MRGVIAVTIICAGATAVAQDGPPPPPPGMSPGDVIVALADQIEVRAQTLQHADDLSIDAMQRIALDLSAHADALVEAAAPMPALARELPAFVVRVNDLLHDADLGGTFDVKLDAESLLPMLQSLRNRARNLDASDDPTDFPPDYPAQ